MPTLEFDASKIDAIFASLDQCHLPGAAVGIAIEGKPVYRKGFGLANLELPIGLSPGIRMRIGSTSKHFAALAYLLLCEDGKARLDDPIGNYLPELHRVAQPVTMRQLLTHTSGLRDAFDIRYQLSGTSLPVTSERMLSLYRCMDDLNGAPGAAWSYNNGGYLLVSAAIERIAGEPLEEFLKQRIFTPAGMHDTELRRWDSDFLPNSATLHMTRVGGGFEKSYLSTALTGEGGVVSSVDDMLRWLAHLDCPVVGNAESWRAMKAPQALLNGISTGYGLGLMIGTYRGVETLAHAGGVMGGNSQMLKVPSAGLDITVMVNRHDISAVALTNRILDASLEGLHPPSKRSDEIPATGVFQSTGSGRVIQLSASEGQQIASIDGAELPMVSEDGRLNPAAALSYLKYSIEREGDPHRPSAIRFTDFGHGDRLVAVIPPDMNYSRAIEGRYRCGSIGVEARIDLSSDGAQLRTLGEFGSATFDLKCLGAGLWRAKSPGAMPWGGILTLDADSGFVRFSTSRTRGLPFRRIDS